MRKTSKSSPHHGARVGGGMKLLPRLFSVLLSCKVPSDPDPFLGQKFDIFFCFLFSMSDHPRGLLENPTFSDVTRVQPIFDSEFTTEQRRLDLWINRNCCSVPQY